MEQDRMREGLILIDERAAARMLSVSVRTLFNLRKRNALPFIKLGATIRYRVAALEKYLSQLESNSPHLHGV